MKIVNVTEANANLLYEARLAVDGPFKDEGKVRREILKYSTGKDGRRALLFIEEQKPLGYIEVKLTEELPSHVMENLDGSAHIARVGVIQSARGKGIGKQLLDEAEGWIKSEGKKCVWLDYLTKNQAAAHLYASCGYKDLTEFPDARHRSRKIAVKQW